MSFSQEDLGSDFFSLFKTSAYFNDVIDNKGKKIDAGMDKIMTRSKEEEAKAKGKKAAKVLIPMAAGMTAYEALKPEE